MCVTLRLQQTFKKVNSLTISTKKREKNRRYYYRHRKDILKKQAKYQYSKRKYSDEELLEKGRISDELNLTIDQVAHRWKGFNKVIDVNGGRLK